MIQTIRKAWGIPELRKKIIFTLLILLIFRIGNAITVPYVDVGLLETYLDQMGGTILGLYNVMSGGACPGNGLRPEHPALYQRIHHHPAADCGHPGPGAAGQGWR